MKKVCYTVIFSDYEELKEPKVITPGWEYICYTDQPLKSDVWQIKRVELLAGESPQRMARYFKIMEWIDWERSFWIDASFVINRNLEDWWNGHFRKGFTAAAHPLRNDWYNEAFDCLISKRGDREELQKQMAAYTAEKLPRNGGVITSGILMRENKPEIISLCEEWWKEVSKHSARDQIAFCKVSRGKDNLIHTYRWDYRRSTEFIYHLHFARRGGSNVKMSVK